MQKRRKSLAISKVDRRNKTEVKHIVNPYKTSTKEKIISCIGEAEDGLTFGEIYAKMPKMSPRNIREHIQKLKNNDRLIMETCRCHASTIYYLR
jgi:hypothetical protein